MNSPSANLRQLCLALAAMALGLAIAWSQLALRPSNGISPSVAAKVGDTLVSSADFQRALAATESARRNALSAGQREAVLNKLISEQLLLQYGEELGLVRIDPTVRKPLVQSVLGLVRANVSPPDEVETQSWYNANAAQFTPPELYRVRVYQFDQPGQAELAAAMLLADQSLTPELNKARLSYLPETLLPRAKLQDYLGEAGWQLVADSTAPAVIGPQPLLGTVMVIHLLEKRQPIAPPLAVVREQVVNEIIRQRGEAALEALLAQLRRDYGVKINRDLLDE